MEQIADVRDVVIVGGGAAGLATSIFARRHNPAIRVAIVDGAKKLGAKILVSGGGRCNVTNVRVTTDDFRGGSRNSIRKVLDAFTVGQSIQFFNELGVTLHEEEHGKLFPDSNDANTVLQALIGECYRVGVEILEDHRVQQVSRRENEFVVHTTQSELRAKRLVLATGGQSLPKTGSDGFGYQLAQSLGHSFNPTIPALVPLKLLGEFHAQLSGTAQDVELTLAIPGQKPIRQQGAMLWTHFGISGPVVLDISRYWHAAKLAGQDATLTASFLPGSGFDDLDQQLAQLGSARPKAHLRNALAEIVPARVADALLAAVNIDASCNMGQLSREHRRKLTHALLAWPLTVIDSRGYNYAEVTAGGIPLTEIDTSTMESRRCPGLFLVGEVLDVDGRIGGFNFQWAWSGGFVAGRALAGSVSKNR